MTELLKLSFVVRVLSVVEFYQTINCRDRIFYVHHSFRSNQASRFAPATILGNFQDMHCLPTWLYRYTK